MPVPRKPRLRAIDRRRLQPAVNSIAVVSSTKAAPGNRGDRFHCGAPVRCRDRRPAEDMRVGRRDAVLHRPQVPVVHHGAGQQNADAAGERAQHGEPPGPAMDRFHGRVEAHRPAPEQRRALGGRAAIDDLLDLALAAETARPPGWSRRASRTAAPSRTGTRSTACGTGCRKDCRSGCENAAVQSRCGKMPNGTASPQCAHQQRPDEAQHQHTARSPTANAQATCVPMPERAGAPIDARPPQQDRGRQEEAGHQPPAALVQRRKVQCRRPAAAAPAPARATGGRIAIGFQFTEANMLRPMISMATKPQISDATPRQPR